MLYEVITHIFPQGRAATLLSEVSKAPIFVSWSFQLNTGTIGGAVVNGWKLGEIGASTLSKIIAGEPTEKIVNVSDNIITNIYDYQVVKRYNIDLNKLPDNTQLINNPPTFFYKHRQVLVPAVVIRNNFV